MFGQLHRWISVFAVGASLGVACGGEEDDDCTSGTEACECINGACLEGLVCLSGYCVDPLWTPPTGGGDANGDAADGSGDGGTFDNVSACQALIDELECGQFDLSSVIDCGLYVDYPCDIADYFDCVRDMVTCVDGTLDTSGIIGCADMATCA